MTIILYPDAKEMLKLKAGDEVLVKIELVKKKPATKYDRIEDTYKIGYHNIIGIVKKEGKK